MPLGIDRTHFYAEKVKKQEKDIRVSISKLCTIFLEESQKMYRIMSIYMYPFIDQGRKNCTTRNRKCYALSEVGPASWDSAECQAGEFLIERPGGVGTNLP